MKKILRIALIVVGVLVIAFLGLKTFTKKNSPEETVTFDKSGLKTEVSYCRPAMKGRAIFGGLVPYNQVWRTGANEATLISFNRDVMIAGQSLKAGNYSLWTVPKEGSWTIVINSETGQWGTNYNEKADVLRVEVPSEKTTETTELFTITFNDAEGGADLSLLWENTKAIVPIR